MSSIDAETFSPDRRIRGRGRCEDHSRRRAGYSKRSGGSNRHHSSSTRSGSSSSDGVWARSGGTTSHHHHHRSGSSSHHSNRHTRSHRAANTSSSIAPASFPSSSSSSVSSFRSPTPSSASFAPSGRGGSTSLPSTPSRHSRFRTPPASPSSRRAHVQPPSVLASVNHRGSAAASTDSTPPASPSKSWSAVLQSAPVAPPSPPATVAADCPAGTESAPVKSLAFRPNSLITAPAPTTSTSASTPSSSSASASASASASSSSSSGTAPLPLSFSLPTLSSRRFGRVAWTPLFGKRAPYESSVASLSCEVAHYATYTDRLVSIQRSRGQHLISRIRGVVQGMWRSASVAVFGSFSNGLWLPNSDLDLVIVRGGGKRKAGGSAVAVLSRLAKHLRATDYCATVKLIDTAKIPVLKLRAASPEGGNQLFQLDITVDAADTPHSGLAASDMLQQYAARLPHMKPLVYVLKTLLRHRGLNEAFRGGLSSYSISLMVISYLLVVRSKKSLPPVLVDTSDWLRQLQCAQSKDPVPVVAPQGSAAAAAVASHEAAEAGVDGSVSPRSSHSSRSTASAVDCSIDSSVSECSADAAPRSLSPTVSCDDPTNAASSDLLVDLGTEGDVEEGEGEEDDDEDDEVEAEVDADGEETEGDSSSDAADTETPTEDSSPEPAEASPAATTPPSPSLPPPTARPPLHDAASTVAVPLTKPVLSPLSAPFTPPCSPSLLCLSDPAADSASVSGAAVSGSGSAPSSTSTSTSHAGAGGSLSDFVLSGGRRASTSGGSYVSCPTADSSTACGSATGTEDEADDSGEKEDEVVDEDDEIVPSGELGDLLLGFLQFYGSDFDYSRWGLSVRFGGFVFSVAPYQTERYDASGNVSRVTSNSIVIEDPLFPGSNAASSAFAYATIALLFEDLHSNLQTFRPSKFMPTMLSVLVPRCGYADATIIKRK